MPGFSDPAYEAERAALDRRRKMVEALMQGTHRQEMAGGLVIPYSGGEAIANLLAKGLAAYSGNKVDAEQKSLEEKRQSEMAQRLASGLAESDRLRTGGPAQQPAVDDEGFQMPPAPNIPGDSRAAAMALINSGHPMLQQAGVGQLFKGEEAYTLKPGEERYVGNRRVAGLPEKPTEHVVNGSIIRTPVGPGAQPEVVYKGEQPTPESVRALEEYMKRSGIDPASPQGQAMFGEAAKKASTHQPAAAQSVNINEGQKGFNNEKELRGEFNKQSEPFIKVRDAYATVKGSLAGDITAPATLTAATKFMKMLDPESVVRESELQMALRSTGMLDRFMNLHNVVQKGNVLTPAQAQEIQRISTVLYDTAAKQQARIEAHYTKLANDYQLDPSRVVRNLGAVTDNRLTKNSDGSWTYTP